MSRKRSLSDDERALWDAVTRAIAPLKRRRSEKADRPNGVPISRKIESKAAGAAVVPSRRPAPPPLAPLGRRLRQKLGRGSEPIDARIDLHGMTQDRAHAALARFLARAQRDGVRVALVITGKGAREATSERGVLKRQVPLWLESAEFRALVVGFEDAGIGHGGAGALYVRVRRARE